MQHNRLWRQARQRRVQATNGLCWLALALVSSLLPAQVNQLPRQLENVGVEERLGNQVSLDLEFVSDGGRVVKLRDYFRSGRPVVLSLVYYECPQLCSLVLNGLTSGLDKVDWTAGKEYEVVTVTINPQETWQMARDKRAAYLAAYGRDVEGGWPFLADYSGNAARLAREVGWKYRYDERQKQYAHAAAVMVLTPEGRVSRYLYGIRHQERDLRLALVEASQGKLGSAIDKVLMFCFHYDPAAQSYVLFATNVMRAGGVLIVVILSAVVWWWFRHERRRRAAYHRELAEKGSMLPAA